MSEFNYIIERIEEGNRQERKRRRGGGCDCYVMSE